MENFWEWYTVGFFFSRNYDLLEANDQIFAKIHAGLFRVWTFDLLDLTQKKIGFVTKKWGGFIKEIFTDADRYVVKLEQIAKLSLLQKAVVLGAAVSIDFDYFENNQKKQSVLDAVT